MIYNIELTDTFGGEANYSWVKRKSFEAPDTLSKLAVIRRAKALLDLNGIRTTTENWGDMYCLKIHSACMVAFISWEA